MLNLKPGSTSPAREDLPLLPLTASFDLAAGTYYFAAGSLVKDTASAAVFDNSGERWLRGIKVFAGANVPADRPLVVVPCVSTDDGASWTAITKLEVALGDARRAALSLLLPDIVNLKDKSAVVYRVILSKALKATLTATLYVY